MENQRRRPETLASASAWSFHATPPSVLVFATRWSLTGGSLFFVHFAPSTAAQWQRLVDSGGRNGNRLDRGYLCWRIRWVARRAVHEERDGASHEHRPWHRRSRYC